MRLFNSCAGANQLKRHQDSCLFKNSLISGLVDGIKKFEVSLLEYEAMRCVNRFTEFAIFEIAAATHTNQNGSTSEATALNPKKVESPTWRKKVHLFHHSGTNTTSFQTL